MSSSREDSKGSVHTPELSTPQEESLRSFFLAPPPENAKEQYCYFGGGVVNVLLPVGTGAIICGLITKKQLLLHAGLLQLLLCLVGIGVICSIVYGVSMFIAAAKAAIAAAKERAAARAAEEDNNIDEEGQQQQQQLEEQQELQQQDLLLQQEQQDMQQPDHQLTQDLQLQIQQQQQIDEL